MLIIGCDFHTRFQQIAMVDTTTGEMIERRLSTTGPAYSRDWGQACPLALRQ
jgi:predicted flap endonuclease-1-like 5' DNA nuclease